jgi:hypothetical protein
LKRRLFLLFRVGAVIVGVAALTLWARSYRTYDDLALTWCGPFKGDTGNSRWGHVTVGTRKGTLSVRYERDEEGTRHVVRDRPRDWWVEHTSGPVGGREAASQFEGKVQFQVLGFGHVRRDPPSPGGILVVSSVKIHPVRISGGMFFVPLWAVVLMCALPLIRPTLAIVRRSARRRSGRCPGCGFDLRASPERCPECGAAAGDFAPNRVADRPRVWRGWRAATTAAAAAFAAAALALHPPPTGAPAAGSPLDAPPAPASPHGLTADAVDARNVRLTWRDDVGDRDRYVIEAFTTSTGWQRRAIAGGDARSAVVFVPADCSEHSFRLRAERRSALSAPTGAVTAATPLADPRDVEAAAVSSREVDVSWQGGPQADTGYEVERSDDGKPFVKLAAAVTRAEYGALRVVRDTQARSGGRYSYRVRAVRGAAATRFSPAVAARTPYDSSGKPAGEGTAPPASQPATQPADHPAPPPEDPPPDEPAWAKDPSFVAPVIDDGRAGRALRRAAVALICFLATVAAVWAVTLFRRTSPESARLVGPITASAAAWAGAVWAAWPNPPPAPESLRVEPSAPWSLKFRWDDRSCDASRTVIEIAPGGSADWRAVAHAGPGETASFASASAFATGAPCNFRVRAANAFGESDPSPVAGMVVPLAGPASVEGRWEYPWVELRWTESPSVTSHHVERWEPGRGFVHLDTLPRGRLRLMDRNARPDSRYVYRIRGENSAGVKSPWTRVTVSIHPLLEHPDVPTGLRAVARHDTAGGPAVTLHWNDVPRAAKYAIWRYREEGPQDVMGHVSGDTVTFTDTNVAPAVAYRYSVSAMNRNGAGNWSDAATVTVPGPATQPSKASHPSRGPAAPPAQ